jgi:hypothetical protein
MDVFFIYTGQERRDNPRDVTRVKVHPSVTAIKDDTFHDFSQLMYVHLGEGLN